MFLQKGGKDIIFSFLFPDSLFVGGFPREQITSILEAGCWYQERSHGVAASLGLLLSSLESSFGLKADMK